MKGVRGVRGSELKLDSASMLITGKRFGRKSGGLNFSWSGTIDESKRGATRG